MFKFMQIMQEFKIQILRIAEILYCVTQVRNFSLISEIITAIPPELCTFCMLVIGIGTCTQVVKN